MKIWVDDIRTPPDESWAWFKDADQTIAYLRVEKTLGCCRLEIMSLDHDLGYENTTRDIVKWMCYNDFWPDEVVVHSQNPVGREWLEGMIKRYKP